MSDLSADVKWQEILRETESGDIPHCRAVSVPAKYHQEITEALAEKILGSFRPSHPDLLIIGTTEKAPPIGDSESAGTCRWLIENIALKPVESSHRLGVIMSADKLLLPAANSLLKLAEEPPEHAVLLFLMEDGRLFLPTLKSRSRFTAITIHEEQKVQRIPVKPLEWVKWLASARKEADSDLLTETLESWANFAVSEQNFVLSEKCEKLRLIAEKNLSVAMLCDMIILMFGDDDGKYEHILDDLR